MLGPDDRALLRVFEHGAHRALQMRPLHRDSVFDRAIAGQPVQCCVKRYVRLDKSQYRRIRPEGEPCCEGAGRRPSPGRVDPASGHPLGGQPGRQRVECRSDLVKLTNTNGVDDRDGQSPSAVFLDELLLLEHPQGVADRLARYPEHPAKFLLTDTLAGRKRAIGNGFDQALVGAVDQSRLRIERPQATNLRF